jgi:hypothetical protein
MSWSITVDDLQDVPGLPDSVLAGAARDNPAYELDARLAFQAAKDAGLVSATLSGGRTPSPYGGPDTVVISVLGFSDRRVPHAVPRSPGMDPPFVTFPARYPPDDYGESFYTTMLNTIMSGADPAEGPGDAGQGAV